MPSYIEDCLESLRIAGEQLHHATNALVAYRTQGREIDAGLIEEAERLQGLVDDLRGKVETL